MEGSGLAAKGGRRNLVFEAQDWEWGGSQREHGHGLSQSFQTTPAQLGCFHFWVPGLRHVGTQGMELAQ